MIKKIEGIIISTTDYKESSKIINIFTENDGVIGVLAKGCKNYKSKIFASSNTLTYGTFYLKYYKGSVPLLMEVDIIDNFKTIRKDIIKTNYAIYLLELTTKVYKHDEDGNIYKLLINGLKKINEDYDAKVITSIVELQLLPYLGIKPELNCCINCSSKKDIITISSHKGGCICASCLEDDFIYNIKTIALIKMLSIVDLSKVTKIEINDKIKKEISTFIDDYYDRYSGLYLNSKKLLEEFIKTSILE